VPDLVFVASNEKVNNKQTRDKWWKGVFIGMSPTHELNSMPGREKPTRRHSCSTVAIRGEAAFDRGVAVELL